MTDVDVDRSWENLSKRVVSRTTGVQNYTTEQIECVHYKH